MAKIKHHYGRLLVCRRKKYLKNKQEGKIQSSYKYESKVTPLNIKIGKELFKRIEIIGTLPENLKGLKVLWGFEPSGRLHKGHLNPIKALNWLSEQGAIIMIWAADSHAILNNKEICDYKSLEKYVPANAVWLLESEYISMRWFNSLLELSKVAGLKRTMRSIDCAGRTEEGLKMSSLNYALLQAVDMHLLNADIVVGGIDQRKVHMLARDCFPKLKWKVPVMIHTELLLGKDGKKMSKSNPNFCEFI